MAHTAADTVAGRLAERWVGVHAGDLPCEALAVARHCVFDWLGCAVAGSQEPLARILVETLSEDGPGRCSIVGYKLHLPGRAAAMANGTAGHALDFDDTNMAMVGHPTAPVLPALLTLAERTNASAGRLLTALVVGIEVECALGELLNPAHYRAGWHSTGTLGTIGAAAAGAHLIALDPGRFAHALALAATQAAGLKASFGTMAKPFHAGHAAADGLLATRLAAKGFEGNLAVIEAPQGLASAAGPGAVDFGVLDAAADRWYVLETLFKWHAACYLTHSAMNAAASLRDKVDVGAIDRVEVHVAPDLLDVCTIPEPSNGLEAKFSVRATTAMTLLGDDTAALASYSDQRMGDAELTRLRDRITVVTEPGRPQTSARVVVVAGGAEVEAEDDTSIPAADLPAQWERLSVKFRALATPVLGTEKVEALVEALSDLEKFPSGHDLLPLAQPPIG